MNCKNCRAPNDESSLICAYCGTALVAIVGAEVELVAVDESLRMLSAMAAQNRDVIGIIGVMWTPQTVEAVVRLSKALLTMGVAGDAQSAVAGAAGARAKQMLKMALLENPSDARLNALLNAAGEREKDVTKGKNMAIWAQFGWVLAFAVFAFGGLYILFKVADSHSSDEAAVSAFMTQNAGVYMNGESRLLVSAGGLAIEGGNSLELDLTKSDGGSDWTAMRGTALTFRRFTGESTFSESMRCDGNLSVAGGTLLVTVSGHSSRCEGFSGAWTKVNAPTP